MHTLHLGIDVAKAKLDCALRMNDGRIRHKVVANSAAGFDELHTWLDKHGVSALHVCMEATGIYWEAVAQRLAQSSGFTVSVINPAQIKAFGGKGSRLELNSGAARPTLPSAPSLDRHPTLLGGLLRNSTALPCGPQGMPGTQAGSGWTQFSKRKPRTLPNPRTLSVTKVAPSESACAAIHKSLAPIGVPLRSRSLRMLA